MGIEDYNDDENFESNTMKRYNIEDRLCQEKNREKKKEKGKTQRLEETTEQQKKMKFHQKQVLRE